MELTFDANAPRAALVSLFCTVVPAGLRCGDHRSLPLRHRRVLSLKQESEQLWVWDLREVSGQLQGSL